MEKWIRDIMYNKKKLLENMETDAYMSSVEKIGDILSETLRSKNKILIAGNGGSAADAQHFAGEIVGRFILEREPLAAMSLSVDPSVVTSIANDYGYDQVFARQVAGCGKEGDVFVAITTSGNSTNLIKAISTAKDKGIKTVGLLGRDGGIVKKFCDYALIVPSNSTPRIQEAHIFTIHLLCEMIEKKLFRNQNE